MEGCSSRQQLAQLPQVRVDPLAGELDAVERREHREHGGERDAEREKLGAGGPWELNTTGWMKFCESLIARNETGISTTPKSA
jgi:hypothetical protein